MNTNEDRSLPKYIKVAAIVTFSIATIVQIALGAYLDVLMVAICIIIISWIAVWHFGISNVGAVIVLLFGSNSVSFAFLIKTLIFQTVDSNLYDPLPAFLVVLAGIIELSLAFLIIHKIKLPRIFQPIMDTERLDFIGLVSLCVGLSSFLINQLLSYKVQDFATDDPGIGGFAIFRNFLVLSVIAYTASMMIKSDGKKLIDFKLIFIFSMVVLMGLFDNSKLSLFLPIFAFFLTIFFFNRQVWDRYFRIPTVVVVILLTYFFPVITYFRQMNITGLSLTEKYYLIRNTLENESFRELMDNSRYYTDEAYARSYYDYFGGNGRFQMLAGRFSSVQEIDPIVALINPNFPLGWEPINLAFQAVLPRMFYPEKDISNDAYYVSRALNLGSQWFLYPTIPLIAVSYASLGIPGMIIIPFVIFLIYLAIYKMIGWNLDNNVFSLFFLAVLFPYIHEGSLQNYIIYILRHIPIMIMVTFAIVQVSKIKLFYPRLLRD